MADDKPRRRSLFHKLTHSSKPATSNQSSSHLHPQRSSSVSDPTSTDDADLSPTAKDQLFAYQLTQPDPRRLGPDAFLHAGIHDSSSVSGRIHGALCAASILSSHASDYKVYTNRITRKLPNQVPWISVHAQRLLVGLLFFWEEELVRWALIDVQVEAERAGYEAVRERMKGEGEAGVAYGNGNANGAVPTDSPPAFRSQPPTPAMFATDQTQPPSHAQSQSQSQSQSQTPNQSQMPPPPSINSPLLESRLQGLWEQHRLALARLESSRRQLPSKRDEAGNRIGMSPGFAGRPPAYGDVLSTVGVFGSPSREASPRWTVGNGEGASAARTRSGTAGTLGGLGEPALPMPGGEKGGVGR